MAEVGLVLFAKTALEVMQDILLAYSHKYSKHTFTQPQLMTILCLVRFEDWTRGAAGGTLRSEGRARAGAGAGSYDDLPLHAAGHRRDARRCAHRRRTAPSAAPPRAQAEEGSRGIGRYGTCLCLRQHVLHQPALRLRRGTSSTAGSCPDL